MTILNYLWSLGVGATCLFVHDLCKVGLYPYDNCRNNDISKFMFPNQSNVKHLKNCLKINENVELFVEPRSGP